MMWENPDRPSPPVATGKILSINRSTGCSSCGGSSKSDYVDPYANQYDAAPVSRPIGRLRSSGYQPGSTSPIPVRELHETAADYQRRLTAWRTSSQQATAAQNNATQLQWFGAVAGVVGQAAQTAAGIVQGALAADAAARQDEALRAAERLANARTEAERAAVAAEAAENAYQKAGLAGVMLSGGDRAGATTKLSEAQGSLAAAVAARAYFEASPARVAPPALVSAIQRAAQAIERTAALISASSLPPPIPSASNPLAPSEGNSGEQGQSTLVKVAIPVGAAAIGFALAGPVGALVGAGVGLAADFVMGRSG